MAKRKRTKGQTTIIGICCFSAKHAALRRKSKDWLARNQDNVSAGCCFGALKMYTENKVISAKVLCLTLQSTHCHNTFIAVFILSRNNIPRLNMSLRSDTLSWFRANQSLLFLLNAACLAEKQQISILSSSVLPDRSWNPRPTALDIAIIRHVESQYSNMVVHWSRTLSYDIPSIDFTVNRS
jgi:hypothetical protein